MRPTGRAAEVYNFAVEGFHTYHVGELGVWVHNVCVQGRLEMFRSYQARGGQLDMRGWVQANKGKEWSPLRGTAGFKNAKLGHVHGNTAGDQLAFLYNRISADDVRLKTGVTQNMKSRYTQAELARGRLVRITEGPRSMMLKLERWIVESHAGPLNKEPWASWRKK